MSDDFLLERMPTARRRPPALAGGAGPRPAYREEAPFKIHGGCGLMGICDESGALMAADIAVRAMAIQRDRGNGLGAGFAGYGIYPEFPDHFCFHLMFHDERAREEVEAILDRSFVVDQVEPIPTRPFGASSGKNMGAFKGVAFPEEIAHFFRLEEYEAYTWLGHNRFPTNTPGWWGGAHPFTLLDWSIVHNGEISSYGINSRYLEQFGYKCSLGTDTEVVAYLFDLMLRRHGLPLELACEALASPLWSEIDRMPPEERELKRSLRAIYGPA